MTIVAALLTSLTIAREWERGTMEQIISMPVKPAELIIGKMIPYFAIGIIDTTCPSSSSSRSSAFPSREVSSFFSSYRPFPFRRFEPRHPHIHSNESQLAASQAAVISSYLPALLLSGFMFSILNMPVPLQAITYLIPARYFVAAIKGIFLKGNTADMLLTEMGLLALFGLIVFTVAVKKFKKRVT